MNARRSGMSYAVHGRKGKERLRQHDASTVGLKRMIWLHQLLWSGKYSSFMHASRKCRYHGEHSENERGFDECDECIKLIQMLCFELSFHSASASSQGSQSCCAGAPCSCYQTNSSDKQELTALEVSSPQDWAQMVCVIGAPLVLRTKTKTWHKMIKGVILSCTPWLPNRENGEGEESSDDPFAAKTSDRSGGWLQLSMT